MSLNLNNVKLKLEQTSCLVHGQHPVVELADSKLNLKCCCDDFKSKCIKNTKSLMAEEAKRAIVQSLNKTLKR